MNADGSEPERLTRGEGAYWDAAWSPDGGRIAVTRADWEGDRIYVMDADGSDSRQLTDIQSGSPSWSPDGRFLAFDGNPEDSEADRIYRLDIETGEVHVLVEAEGTLNQCPTWSPDGRRIAFFRLTLGAAAKPITTANAELFITGPDGSARPLLSTSFSSCPTWAPDGRTVLFAAGNELRLVDVATGRVRRPAPGVLRGSDPDWA
ncbi:MAG TPA: hypothetical protein VEA19_02570 [Actinomycetota bacterium]|nr:hypothetical protein [Actinomycetota bacterium]